MALLWRSDRICGGELDENGAQLYRDEEYEQRAALCTEEANKLLVGAVEHR